jgi:hypothetical protein
VGNLLLDIIKISRKSAKEIVGEDVVRNLDTNVLHLHKGTTDFGDKLLNVAGIKGDIGKHVVYSCSIGWLGGDKSLLDALPELNGVVFIGGIDDVVVGSGGEFGESYGTQDGVCVLGKSGLAVQDLVFEAA